MFEKKLREDNMIGDDDFLIQNADYHSGASDAEKLYGRGYEDYNRNLWRDGILMRPPTLEEQKKNQKNEEGAELALLIVGGGGFILTLAFTLLLPVVGDAYGILFILFIIAFIALFVIFIILYRDNNRIIDKIYGE